MCTVGRVPRLSTWLFCHQVLATAQQSRAQSPHRAATAAFWRTLHQDGKISPSWWGWGCTHTPFDYICHQSTKLQGTIQLRGHTRYTHSISSLYLSTLWSRALSNVRVLFTAVYRKRELYCSIFKYRGFGIYSMNKTGGGREMCITRVTVGCGKVN